MLNSAGRAGSSRDTRVGAGTLTIACVRRQPDHTVKATEIPADIAATVLMPISAVANKPLRVETRVKQVADGSGGFVPQQVKFPVWFEPVAYGGTPMCEAIDLAWHVLGESWRPPAHLGLAVDSES